MMNRENSLDLIPSKKFPSAHNYFDYYDSDYYDRKRFTDPENQNVLRKLVSEMRAINSHVAAITV